MEAFEEITQSVTSGVASSEAARLVDCFSLPLFAFGRGSEASFSDNLPEYIDKQFKHDQTRIISIFIGKHVARERRRNV